LSVANIAAQSRREIRTLCLFAPLARRERGILRERRQLRALRALPDRLTCRAGAFHAMPWVKS
jgi:hypothetical protein